MIFGVYYKEMNRPVPKTIMKRMDHSSDSHSGKSEFRIFENIGMGIQEHFIGERFSFTQSNKEIFLLFQGRIYNSNALGNHQKTTTHEELGALIIQLYQQQGDRFIENLRGKFGLMLYDRKKDRFILARDHLGIETLYYFEDNDQIVFGSSIDIILSHPDVKKQLNVRGLYQFLLFCYNPSFETLFEGIQKLRPGYLLKCHQKKREITPYWKLSFANPMDDHEEKIKEDLLNLLQESVNIRLPKESPVGIFLSGGMDSSSVVSLTAPNKVQEIITFSYRCRSESFDESYFAQFVADYFHTKHHVVDYGPESVSLMSDIVQFMDEPFCDIGINIATELLGRSGSGRIQTVLTGDGGDELFGGHPVYLADPIGRMIDTVPGFIKNPILWIGAGLPDSRNKKDFWIKWKRFSVSTRFPERLFSHRWRIYYTPDELKTLLYPDFLQKTNLEQSYQSILDVNREADGPDHLSRSLYSDYQTVVGFYLRRMDLIRRYGIETRFPLLDHKLIEFCARIPSNFKIHHRSDSKYILKKTMENLLPREIVYRKDKLGHSIPLKNWMRDNQEVRSFFYDLLSPENIKKRGIFNWEMISKLIAEHETMQNNHSHRLWALVVLELWMRRYFNSVL